MRHYSGRPATGVRVPRTEKRCTGEFSSKSREGRPTDSPVDTNRVIQTRLSLSHSGLRERHAPTHPSSKLWPGDPFILIKMTEDHEEHFWGASSLSTFY